MSPPKRGRRLGVSLVGGGEGEGPPHPLARAIEQLYAAGATPRLMIDARRADVVVPDFLRAKWAAQLVIDLDAAYPLDLAYDTDGVHANLAFSGVVTRCTFSWPSIYQVIDRGTGRGIMIPAHEPAVELPADLLYVAQAVTEVVESKKHALSAVPPLEKSEKALEKPSEKSEKTDASASSSASDEAAKARRAKFRVIEGG